MKILEMINNKTLDLFLNKAYKKKFTGLIEKL